MPVSIAAAAKDHSVSKRTIERLIATGELPAYRIGRSVRIREVDLEAVLRPVRPGDAA